MSATPANRCPNCDASQTSPPTPFCAQCGQESRVRAPTLLQFMQEFGGAYISTEGALWRSLKLLLARPGALTLDYLRGKRRSYVLPLRLYLTISVLTLAMLRLISHAPPDPKREADMERALREGVMYVLSVGPVTIGREHGRYVCQGLPDWYCQRARERLDAEPKLVVHSSLDAMSERIVGSMGRAMFLLLPLFACWLKLLFWRTQQSGLRYTEHLVFALHLHTVWFIALWPAMLNAVLGALGGVAALAYLGLALQAVYQRGWLGTLWRMVLLLVLQASLLVASLFASALMAVIV